MRYVCREGIVLTKIAGEWLLIPTRKASESCPHIMRLALPCAMMWGCLEKGGSMGDVYRIFRVLTKKEDKEVRQLVDRLMSELIEKGYLIASDPEEQEGC